ncbi:response regulator transcription factor [Janibacter sp. YIM B02568]|uniref:response regulator transcription factor n=1 Tax=Janibacter endophyticus TaxID=2806261 RepID=UPI0019508D54|nr:response regulator transcription factor [Janibacter endophyticus]MBM6546282.1 response regulator transcription factor [Janibacter endophyticus]
MSTSPTTTPATVLVIEDEKPLADMVVAYLARAGYQTLIAHTGPAGVQAARESRPEVVILDLGLPGLDGIEVCRQIRTFSDCYVIVATARSDEIDTLIGLSVGADDYVTKPFSVRELVARVQTVLRRPRTASSAQDHAQPPRVFGELSVDPSSLQVHLRGEPVALTPTERDLLMTLASRPSMAFSRRQLIDDVWGGGWVGDEHLVDVHIAHLRKKLGDNPDTGRYVTTVRGVGYRMGPG